MYGGYMKKFVFAALLCALCGGLNAQRAQPLETGSAGGPKAAVNTKTGGGIPGNKRHTVADGDTLWYLSQKYYGDPFKWRRLYNANIGSIPNPDQIYPGNELDIPDLIEEEKPAVQEMPVMGEDETLKDPETRSSEIITAEDPVEPENQAEVKIQTQPKPLPQPAETLEALFKDGDLSEDMPSDQKEWSSGVKIVGDDWREDGVIAAKAASDLETEEGFSLSGETVLVSLLPGNYVKKGDRLDVYLKGASAYNKKGNRLGFELQRAGIIKILKIDGSRAEAIVLDASTSIHKGLIVKKQ